MSKPTLAEQLQNMADWIDSGSGHDREPNPDTLREIAGEVKELEAALREHRPWDCADCGPMVKIDEDSRCSTCGRYATFRAASLTEDADA